MVSHGRVCRGFAQDTPKEWKDLIYRCCDKDPEQRATLAEVIATIERMTGASRVSKHSRVFTARVHVSLSLYQHVRWLCVHRPFADRLTAVVTTATPKLPKVGHTLDGAYF